MRKSLFLRIVNALENRNEYFRLRCDATGRQGLSPLQKCPASIRMLAYGVAADALDEYLHIGESTAMECLMNFVCGVIEEFETEYLREPNDADVRMLLQVGEACGFPRMLRSIDCMNCEWKNCLTAWHGQFCRGDYDKPTIMLEVVASQDTWFWHAFFGTPGSCNDPNVLNRSPVFNNILEGRAPQIKYMINGVEYKMGYYLAHGIYPDYATIVKTRPRPQGVKRQLFAKTQESVRKGVERAFGVLQSRFAIVRDPARIWSTKAIWEIMRACVTLHNMIVEDERDIFTNYQNLSSEWEDGESSTPTINSSINAFSFDEYRRRNMNIRDRRIHHNLQADLVEHIWQRFGAHNN